MAQTQFKSTDTEDWIEKYGNGSDGNTTISSDTTDNSPNSTLTGTVGTTAATIGSFTGFADGDLVLIHQTQGSGAGAWELNKINSHSGLNLTLRSNLKNTYVSGAQIIKLRQLDVVTINSGKIWSCPAWDGSKGGILVVLAKTSITVTGNVSGSGLGSRGGRTTTQNEIPGFSGDGTTGNSIQQQTANGTGGGGSSGSSGNVGGGGGGGHSASGTNGVTGSDGSGGAGGGTGGVANLTTMVMGGGAGSASAKNEGGRTGGKGGNGGGIIFFISPTIVFTGGGNSNGANGANGAIDGNDGGGGAGGSILLKGVDLTLGTNLLTVANGAAGASFGGAGAVGRIHADYATSISGSATPAIDSTHDTSILNFNAYFTTLNDTLVISEVLLKSIAKTLTVTALTLSEVYGSIRPIVRSFSDIISHNEIIKGFLNGISARWSKDHKDIGTWIGKAKPTGTWTDKLKTIVDWSKIRKRT